jgi:CRP-like cAMP-binding protein
MLRAKDLKIERLRATELFSGLRAEELRRIARLVEDATVPAGTVLAREGTTVREFGVIVSGSAILTTRAGEIAIIGEGSLVGETGLLTDAVHVATVVTLTPVRMFVFEARAFEGLLAASPRLARRLLHRLSVELREAQRESA